MHRRCFLQRLVCNDLHLFRVLVRYLGEPIANMICALLDQSLVLCIVMSA